ncbi:ATP phosphoribosyltransferase regulatory subunit [Virgibacillus halophilus]|uniref:ATP phosphoribosyltransferase regulatory subunit n=1 Tax=Tigheibacillus halophilus TaxID=361280 RepID=A0ABU5C931_9BACI|nr:ATP phosphoribosyltransferase regulatory subunit [Virgibacillus halophilus]
MKVFTFDTMKANNQDFQSRKQLLSLMQRRFSLFGYEHVHTSVFEPYELYSQVAGTIAQDDMIKVIDPSGKVLVLRPDATIPVTKEVAKHYHGTAGHIRYFYMMDVFRQSFDGTGSKEKTQAGVECFGEKSAAIDGEVIALAVETLQDMKTPNFKIEVGHANFFKQLLTQLPINDTALKQLKTYIQAKNMTEIAPFLTSQDVPPYLVEKISQIPLLYGEPKTVMERAQNIILNDTMRKELDGLWEVYEVLCTYGVSEQIVFDLGLINHMNYYSGIIFQGFVDQVAKPVLMGGRYDQLAAAFGNTVPAVGFAIDAESLLEEAKIDITADLPGDITIIYETNKLSKALKLAGKLRNAGWRVITAEAVEQMPINSKQIIQLEASSSTWICGEQVVPFTTIEELEKLIVETVKKN